MADTPVVDILADGVKITLPAETMTVLASAAALSGITAEQLILDRVTEVVEDLQGAVYEQLAAQVGQRYLLADATARASIDALLPPLPVA